jgi:hypothetical protein
MEPKPMTSKSRRIHQALQFLTLLIVAASIGKDALEKNKSVLVNE